jgi:hypothetical protein
VLPVAPARWLVGSLALALLAGGPAPAAADEGESALSFSLGYASFAIPEHEPRGGSIGLEFQHGLGEDLWVRAAVAGAAYATGGEASWTGQGTVGLTYVVDVLRYVPYLNAGVGAVMLGGGPLDRALHPVVELGAGLDVLARRGLSYGVFVRLASFLDDSAFVSAGARVTWRWGFF